MPPILEGKDLHKVYEKDSRKIEVLKGITFSLEAGNSYGIVGASGSGKSTLLHLLGGLDVPSQGKVYFEGEALDEKTDPELSLFRNKNLGFVFQFHHLLPHFSSLENVMMPCLIAGESKGEARLKAEKILEELGLQERLKNRPYELSGGEQQRVAIARALILQPKILMADEPTGNLDHETSQRVLEQLLRLSRDRNATLLVVTHNEVLSQKFKYRIRMEDGKLFSV